MGLGAEGVGLGTTVMYCGGNVAKLGREAMPIVAAPTVVTSSLRY